MKIPNKYENFFIMIEENPAKANYKAQCLIEECKTPLFTGSTRNSSHLIRHLRRYHPGALDEIEAATNNDSQEETININEATLATPMKIPHKYENFFEILEENAARANYRAQCLIEDCKSPNFTGFARNTSHLIRHLPTHHPGMLDGIEATTNNSGRKRKMAAKINEDTTMKIPSKYENFFIIVEENPDKGNYKAQCFIEGCKTPLFIGFPNTPAHLRRHLRTHHPGKLEEIEGTTYDDSRDKEKTVNVNKAEATTSMKIPNKYENFFKILEENAAKGNFIAQCLIQDCKSPKFTAFPGNTSHLIRHLRTHHPGKLDGTEAAPINDSPKRKTTVNIHEAVVDYMINGMQPFSLIESTAFSQLIQRIRGETAIISRPSIIQKLEQRFFKMQKSIEELLTKQVAVCVTFNCWSTQRRSFLGSTAHYIDCNTLERKVVTLACSRIIGQHTYDELSKRMHAILTDYNIQNLCNNVVTDTVTHMIKGFDLCQQVPEEETVILPDDCITVTPLTELLDDKSLLDNPLSIANNNDDGQEINLPPHLRCAVHTLNLVTTVDFEEAIRSNLTIGPKYIELMKKCSNIWNAQRRSTVDSDRILEMLGKFIKTPKATRWNTKYEAMKDLLEHLKSQKIVVDNICTLMEIPWFEEDDVNLLQILVNFFEPIAGAMDTFQDEENVFCAFCGITIPVINALGKKLKKYTDEVEYEFDTIGTILIDAVQHRFTNVMSSTFFMKATAMHPEFKIKYFDMYLKEKKEYIERLLQAEYERISSEIESANDLTDCSAPKKEKKFWEIDDEILEGNCSAPKEESKFWEIDYKPPTEDNMLQKYWYNSNIELEDLRDPKFAAVKKLFLTYNTALPLTAKVKRLLLSVRKEMLTPEKDRLPDRNFEMQLLLHENKEVFNTSN